MARTSIRRMAAAAVAAAAVLTLSLGFGLDRIFLDDSLDIDPVVPNIRLVNVGIAF